MSVQPIDLQNLLLRVDQLSRTIGAQQQAAAHRQDAIGNELVQRSRRESEGVNQLARDSEVAQHVDDSAGERAAGEQEKNSSTEHQNEELELNDDVGNSVDISQ